MNYIDEYQAEIAYRREQMLRDRAFFGRWRRAQAEAADASGSCRAA